MKEQLEAIRKQALDAFSAAGDTAGLDALRVQYLLCRACAIVIGVRYSSAEIHISLTVIINEYSRVKHPYNALCARSIAVYYRLSYRINERSYRTV